MSKFLLIGSVAAMLYGDCAWGMGDDIDPWKGTSSGAGQFNAEPARGDASPNIRSRRNSTTFSRDAQTQTEQSPFEQSWSGQAHANPQQLEENRFIKGNGYRQYHYVPLNNSKIGRATPTTVVTVTRDDLRCWNDIAEIRYANDVSYDKLENPKVILYRNKDNSCYIILRIGDNKHGVFYGVNERNVEIGRQSFAVYEVSEDVGSFTDGVERLIYVDESGLYFVPKAENSVEDVIKTYQSEGKFNFRGSVIKVSAVDGTITLNGEPITKDNFFDNWVLEEREVEREVSKEKGRTVIEKVKETKTVLSTKQPDEKEILRNFYPPVGNYLSIYWTKYQSNRNRNTFSGWLNAYGGSRTTDGVVDPGGKDWLNTFINKRVSIVKSKNKTDVEELVKNGTFSSILSVYSDHGQYVSQNSYTLKVRDAIATQIATEGKQTTVITNGIGISPQRQPLSISTMVSQNLSLFKDPKFVIKLKPAFAAIEKDYEHNKESEMWIPFEIVRNL